MTTLIRNSDPAFLKDLHCGCGKPAEMAWHQPVQPRGPKKLSKTPQPEEEMGEPKPSPYGWSCMDHIPPGV